MQIIQFNKINNIKIKKLEEKNSERNPSSFEDIFQIKTVLSNSIKKTKNYYCIKINSVNTLHIFCLLFKVI